jgi:hypothetical protein
MEELHDSKNHLAINAKAMAQGLRIFDWQGTDMDFLPPISAMARCVFFIIKKAVPKRDSLLV